MIILRKGFFFSSFNVQCKVKSSSFQDIFFIKWASRCFPLSLSIKVVKIAIQLVKSYDFTSQYMLNVQNRLKNSKIDKIGLKSSKIGKIGWYRKKSRFWYRFYDFNKKHILHWNSAIYVSSRPIAACQLSLIHGLP